MKKQIIRMLESYNPFKQITRTIFLAILMVFVLGGIKSFAQDTTIIARFVNGHYDSGTNQFSVDVELQCNTENVRMYGFNIRFLYQDNQMSYNRLDSLADFYDEIGTAEQLSGNGSLWNVPGNLIWTNALIQTNLEDYPEVLSTTGWTRMFKIYFNVKAEIEPCRQFCPVIIWDLEENAGSTEGGYLPGDDGVVITVMDENEFDVSLPSHEQADHYNWEYFAANGKYGRPVKNDCIGELCIPVSNWAIYLAIGLMAAASVFIFRRRLS
jgi:hypothetical protein